MRYINDIIVHRLTRLGSASPDPAEKRFHYLVDAGGSCRRGRPASQPGRHCYMHNAHSIGVAYISDDPCEGDTRTKEQKAALLKLLANLTRLYRCRIHGGSDYGKEYVPYFDATAEYAGLYEQLVMPTLIERTRK